MRLLIIADDLTGAADCAAPFGQAGWSAVVLTSPAAGRVEGERFQVLSLSLHTRDASAAGVRRVWSRHGSGIADLAQGALVYQKIDSTLRGHPALEVRLLLDLLGTPAALIAPAFPKQGRQTIDGVHRVQGLPLAETEYARTSARFRTSSRLSEIFTDACHPSPIHLPLPVIERGGETVATWLQERLAAQCRLITADAADESHFDTLTHAVLSLKRRPLLVGSAGWAERLALAWGQWERVGVRAAVERGSYANLRPGVLGLVGSLSTPASRQVRAASESGVTVVTFTTTTRDPAQAVSAEWQSLSRMISAGRHAVVWTNPAAGNPSSRREGQRVLRALALLVRGMLSATAVSGLVLVGGDTAQVVLRALRANGLTVTGQVEAGIPYGRLLDGSFAGLPVVTKAGGFGSDTALWDCLNFLQQRTLQ